MDVNALVPLGKAAKRTSQSEWAIRRGLRQGDIEGVRVGQGWFLTINEVNRLAAEFPLEPVSA